MKPLLAIALLSLAAVTHSPRQQPSLNAPMRIGTAKPMDSGVITVAPALSLRDLMSLPAGGQICVTNKRTGVVQCVIQSTNPPAFQWVETAIQCNLGPLVTGASNEYIQVRTNGGPWSAKVPIPWTNAVEWGWWMAPANAFIQMRAGYSVP
jgi:hypothetical protein